jgi:hypothetical protein
MPTRGEIQEDIVRRKNSSQDDVRRTYARDLSAYTKRDTILYASAFTSKGPAVPPWKKEFLSGPFEYGRAHPKRCRKPHSVSGRERIPDLGPEVRKEEKPYGKRGGT